VVQGKFEERGICRRGEEKNRERLKLLE